MQKASRPPDVDIPSDTFAPSALPVFSWPLVFTAATRDDVSGMNALYKQCAEVRTGTPGNARPSSSAVRVTPTTTAR